ncbi:hypothetical protein DPMN_144871 [Dreissena polymorpha]|uniref:Uncharacterized protein n=1 Tax=Dreissena polymorpha TaxID=45954 RepID=A0A9D4F4V4_DREPO|nr:hypothetical protein DPMN_144871 [Dreissena polymorpha]
MVGFRECHTCMKANCTAPRAVMYSRWWDLAIVIPVWRPTVQLQEQTCTQGGGF